MPQTSLTIRAASCLPTATALLLCLSFVGGTCVTNKTITLCPAIVWLGNRSSQQVTVSCKSANNLSQAAYIYRQLESGNRQSLAYTVRGQQEPSLNKSLDSGYKKSLKVSRASGEPSLSLEFTNVSCPDTGYTYACVNEWNLNGVQKRQVDIAQFFIVRFSPTLVLSSAINRKDSAAYFDPDELVTFTCSFQISRAPATDRNYLFWEFTDNAKRTQWPAECNQTSTPVNGDKCYVSRICQQTFSLAQVDGCSVGYRCLLSNNNVTDGKMSSPEVTVFLKSGTGNCTRDEELPNSLTRFGLAIRLTIVFVILAILVSLMIFLSRRKNTKWKQPQRQKTLERRKMETTETAQIKVTYEENMKITESEQTVATLLTEQESSAAAAQERTSAAEQESTATVDPGNQEPEREGYTVTLPEDDKNPAAASEEPATTSNVMDTILTLPKGQDASHSL